MLEMTKVKMQPNQEKEGANQDLNANKWRFNNQNYLEHQID